MARTAKKANPTRGGKKPRSALPSNRSVSATPSRSRGAVAEPGDETLDPPGAPTRDLSLTTVPTVCAVSLVDVLQRDDDDALGW